MTDSAPSLFPAPPVLKPRQQLVYDAIREAGPEGLTAEECGAIVHEARLQERGSGHTKGARCQYCRQDGLSVLHGKAMKPLVMRKRTRGWVARDPRQRAPDPESSQTDEFPPGF